MITLKTLTLLKVLDGMLMKSQKRLLGALAGIRTRVTGCLRDSSKGQYT